MKRIGYKTTTGVLDVWEAERHSADVVCGALALSPVAVIEFRALLSTPPGMTAEEAEVLAAERELEQWCDKHNTHYSHHRGTLGSHEFVIYGKSTHLNIHGAGSTRTDALRELLAHLYELEAEAEAKKLPEPEAMDWGQCLCEIVLSGAELVRGQYGPEVRRPGKSVMYNAYTIDGLRSAVRYLRHAARELDNQE